MKTLIFVWTQNFYNDVDKTKFCGFGDMLRGTVGALRYCEERDYECIIDITLHPVSQFFSHKPHRFSQLIQDNKNNIKLISQYSTVKDIDAEFEGKDLIFFFSNFDGDCLEKPASQSIKERVRCILTPNEYLESYISTIKQKITCSRFAVLHFRVGDHCFMIKEHNNEYSKYLALIQSINIIDNRVKLLLMSDSAKLKVLSKDIIFSLDGPTGHIGFETDIERLKHTIAEFFILQEACFIFTHSVYPWTSGFVKIINYIYDVHLLDI
jgi:hypothetical protein